MSETMPEKVARAIYEGRNGRGCTPLARLSESHQAPYLADARAAIGAMREPTDAMLREGKFEAESRHIALNVYGAMIDAALSEPTTRERRAEALSDLVEMDQDHGLL